MSLNKNKKSGGIKWLIFIAIFLLAVIVVGGVFGYQKVYAQKFFPGVKIAYLDLAGQTKDQTLDQLKSIEKNVQEKGLRFVSGDKEIMINPIVISATDPDLAKPILIFDWEETIDRAYEVGRDGQLLQNIKDQVFSLILGKDIEINYYLDRDEFLTTLQVNFSELEKPPVDAKLIINGSEVEITGHQSGYIFDYEKAGGQLVQNVKDLNFEPIRLDLVFQEPEIKKEHTGSAVNSLENILKIESLKLLADSRWWKVNKTEFVDWLEFQLIDNEIIVGFNQEKVNEFLGPIAQVINIEARDAKFKLSGKRVTEFQTSRDGKTLNFKQSYEKINQQIIAGNSEDIELVVEIQPAIVATGDLNDLGIKESLGVGRSNFSGSPKNRRHNIATGAAALNGILIAPDEEFSLLDALGEIDGANGYKQELVIKGDRTIPEYGGGLCQVGTTTFRAALRSGLPITQRRNHSYRVSYYEPAGMDATIYNPYPDMKFLNDTGYHILFTTRIEGDELIFELFGTKDDREVVISPDPPSIYKVTEPPKPRYIETEELEPGEKKKVESAHRGADTYFQYTVTYPDGKVVEDDFSSHYIAWPEVWLVGKESTTTQEVIEEAN